MDKPQPAYIGFGMLTPVSILVVDQLPAYNTGALVKQISEYIFDDAACIACLLRQWDIPAAVIGTPVGDDPRGRALAGQLKEWGVQGEVHLSKDIHTPSEVDISDETGARTYFWERSPELLATLDTADLSQMIGARLLYVDWYDGEPIVRAMDEANRLGIPVFLNFEHGHTDPGLIEWYGSRATICQAVTDAAQESDLPPLEVAQKLLRTGVETALITMASAGCLVMHSTEVIRVHAPSVHAIDGCGAGATFSAGFIYGYFMGWDLERTARFATAAASLKVTRAGLTMLPVDQIATLAASLPVESLA
ncbi:MAG TPA: PfkB family carbohydrate kinase [Anaerolineales bacterium]|nr:PfkB family carbohydrate kinase [Anaerolineales bacterium]